MANIQTHDNISSYPSPPSCYRGDRFTNNTIRGSRDTALPTCQRHVRRLPGLEAPQPIPGAVGPHALLDTLAVHRLLVALGRVHGGRAQQQQQEEQQRRRRREGGGEEEEEAAAAGGPGGEHDGRCTPGHGGCRPASEIQKAPLSDRDIGSSTERFSRRTYRRGVWQGSGFDTLHSSRTVVVLESNSERRQEVKYSLRPTAHA